jgi:heme-degrading monooxygenase HmoA
MPYLLVRHRVGDYAKWKPAFDADGPRREAGGSKGGLLLRDTTDQNNLLILFEWDDLERARQFTQSEELKKRMEEGGVQGKPDVYLLESIERLVV